MGKQVNRQEKLLSILRRHNYEIDEICRNWWRSQENKGEKHDIKTNRY